MFNKNSIKKVNNSAFSLVELSIVILIIGILITGATQGYHLIRSAQISNAKGITAKSPIPQTQGLLAWYETSSKESIDQSQIKEGGQITKWQDISPSSIINGNNKLTTTASANIAYAKSAINKIPSIKFTGASKLSLANFTQGNSAQATIFLVIKINYLPDTTNYKTIFDGNSADFSFSIKSDAVQLNSGSSAASTSVASSFVVFKEYAIAIYFNGSNSKVFVNNTDSPIGGSILNLSAGSNQLTGMTLGTNRSGTNGFNGFISEVAVFNRVIKSNERKEIFNYLAKKYKISITGI